MRKAVSFVVCLISAVLTACGGGNDSQQPPRPPATGDAQVQGNWTATATSTVFSGEKTQVDVFIKQTGKTLTSDSITFVGGSGGTCSPFGSTMMGTVSGSAFNLTFRYDSGETAIMTGRMSSSGELIGTYATTGSCTKGDRGGFSARWIPTLTSSAWVGTASSGSVNIPFSADLNEDNNGDLLGTITFPSSSCLATVDIIGGNHVGRVMSVAATRSGVLEGIDVFVNGTVGSNGKSIQGSYQTTEACGFESGTFSMSRP